MKSVLFTIGNFKVHGYGLMIAIGVIAAYLVTEYRAKRNGLDSERIFALTIWCLVGGIIGAKLLYYIVEIENVIADPSMLLDFTDGFVVYGGIMAGIFAGYLYCRYRRLSFLAYFDLVMPAIALAQGFGRIGCFLAGCCYGVETNGPLGVTFPHGSLAPGGSPLVPIQLISSALNFVNFFVLVWIARYKKSDGQIAGLYLIFYSVGRFVVEFWRGDVVRGSVGALSTSQFISVFVVLAGILMFLYFTYKFRFDRWLLEKLGIRRSNAAYVNAEGRTAYSNETTAPALLKGESEGAADTQPEKEKK